MTRGNGTIASAAILGLLCAAGTRAGSLDPPAAPGPTMHTLEEIYQDLGDANEKLDMLTAPATLSDTTPAVEAGYYNATDLTAVDPDLATANIHAGVTIFGVSGQLEVVDTTSGDAVAAEILSGKKAWVDGWEVTGTMPTQTLSPSSAAVAGGYYEATTLNAVDTDLATGNLRAGVTLFGVAGKAEVVDTSSGDAAAAEILSGKTAWVDGLEVIGTIPTQTLSPSSTSVPGGYYEATTLSAVDVDLATGNVRAGVTLFGIAGKTEVVDTASGDAVAAEILSGRTAWVDGVELIGTIPTQTLSPSSAAVAGGYYEATTLDTVDADLATGNVRAGVTLFGVAGKTEVVDTTSGDAAADDIRIGKTAWVDGAEIAGASYPAPVDKTGQVDSYATGDDGDLEKGLAWPVPRFTDNLDGTVTDNLTGLVWLEDANAFGARTWATALTDCATLNSGEMGLTDGSEEGDWRLPNLKELQSLVDYGVYNPCLPADHPFDNVQHDRYWSSTTQADHTAARWYVYLSNGVVSAHLAGYTDYVWPVRDGP